MKMKNLVRRKIARSNGGQWKFFTPNLYRYFARNSRSLAQKLKKPKGVSP